MIGKIYISLERGAVEIWGKRTRSLSHIGFTANARELDYYRQSKALGLMPTYQKEVDQYFADLKTIGIRIEKGRTIDDLTIVEQPLSNITIDQAKKMTEIIDRAAIRLSEVIGMVEELKASMD